MSDPCQEHRPLLCDDYLDEEFHIENQSYQKRIKPSFRNGRARYHAKGAAVILARGPDNCSTSVAYWWLGVVMIAVTIFVIYNCILIFGIMSKPNIKEPEYRIFNNVIKPQLPTPPEVFMHLILNNNTNLNLSKHLPHIDELSVKYPSFKYTVLVVINDTFKDLQDFNDDKRNKIVFDSPWPYQRSNNKRYKEHNISVEYVSLTAYLNDSPIKKFWRHIPPHLIEFLVRSVSIWEKGGISFNPIILTPQTPNPNYIEKLYDILQKYENPRSILKTKATTEAQTVNKKRPNNIQDIINALNKEDNNNLESDLNVADNNEVSTVLNNKDNFRKRKFTSKKFYGINKKNQTEYDIEISEKANYTSEPTHYMKANKMTVPLFLKHLIHANPKNGPVVNVLNTNNSKIFKASNLSLDVITFHNKSNEFIKRHTSDKPTNILNLESNNIDIEPELAIDIKGNIIASKTACHAFLGTMYSNVYRHTEEKFLTDFIISELSFFCNGRLNSCEGIKVILV